MLFFFNDTATTEIYTLSLHDALPICPDLTLATALRTAATSALAARRLARPGCRSRSEEHTSELQSPCNLVCRLLLEKKKEHSSSSVSCRNSVFTPRARSTSPRRTNL